jgi:hypothetical protein
MKKFFGPDPGIWNFNEERQCEIETATVYDQLSRAESISGRCEVIIHQGRFSRYIGVHLPASDRCAGPTRATEARVDQFLRGSPECGGCTLHLAAWDGVVSAVTRGTGSNKAVLIGAGAYTRHASCSTGTTSFTRPTFECIGEPGHLGDACSNGHHLREVPCRLQSTSPGYVALRVSCSLVVIMQLVMTRFWPDGAVFGLDPARAQPACTRRTLACGRREMTSIKFGQKGSFAPSGAPCVRNRNVPLDAWQENQPETPPRLLSRT